MDRQRPLYPFATLALIAVGCACEIVVGTGGGGGSASTTMASTSSGGGSCDDNVKDGEESDVDCGGSCTGCAIGKTCKQNTDCDSGVCTSGQCADFAVWLQEAGGRTGNDQAFFAGLAVDQAGNAVVATNFEGTLSFAPTGAPVYSTADGSTTGFAFARYDGNGSRLWDAGFAGGKPGRSENIAALAGDAIGNFVAVGGYATTGIDFGNGVSVPSPAPASSDAFFVAFATSDSAVAAWPIPDAAGVQGVALAPSGDVIVAGFDGGETCTFGGTTVNKGELFVVDVDVNGDKNKGWGHTYSDGGSASAEGLVGVATDEAGDVIAAGVHTGVIDFSGGVDAGTPAGGFIVKYDAKGHYQWTAGFTATPASMAVDPMGNTVLCGQFAGTIDFGTGPLTSATPAIFLARFSPTGAVLWSKAFAVSETDASLELSVVGADAAGNVLLAVDGNPKQPSGSSITIDFGHAPVSGLMLLAKLDPGGSHLWSRGFAAVGGIQGIAAYNASDVLIAGAFIGPSLMIGTQTVPAHGALDLFLAKLHLPTP
jgi:hypothetical protein